MRDVEAFRRGLVPPPATDPDAAVLAALPLAVLQDPEMFRVFLDLRACIGSPTTVLEQPELTNPVLELAAASEPPPRAGPNREELLTLLA